MTQVILRHDAPFKLPCPEQCAFERNSKFVPNALQVRSKRTWHCNHEFSFWFCSENRIFNRSYLFSPKILKFLKFEIIDGFSERLLWYHCWDAHALIGVRSGIGLSMRNPDSAGITLEKPTKGKSRRNYLVQVSTCWFLLQFVNRLQESLVQFLYSSPPWFSSDRKSPTPF